MIYLHTINTSLECNYENDDVIDFLTLFYFYANIYLKIITKQIYLNNYVLLMYYTLNDYFCENLLFMTFIKKLSPFYNLAILYFIVSFITRVVLIFHPITQSNFDFFDCLKIFTLGLLSDLFVFIVVSSILWLYLIFISNYKYSKPTDILFLEF